MASPIFGAGLKAVTESGSGAWLGMRCTMIIAGRKSKSRKHGINTDQENMIPAALLAPQLRHRPT
jgi:hypothetical protein